MSKGRWLLCGLCCLTLAVGVAGIAWAADDAGDEIIQMVIGLVGEKDKDLRAVGLQQVREGAKGSAATKQFAALLLKLPPESQAALLDALADRGDSTARPAVLEMLKSRDEPVRIAAIRAVGLLGEVADVPPLVQLLATAAGPEKATARASLAHVRGQSVNAAIVAQSKQAKPNLRVELIGVLTARRAVDSVPALLAAAEDTEPTVRMAAMSALGQLASLESVADMLAGVLTAKPGPEREAAEKAVMFVCNRAKDPDRRAEPLLAAWAKRSEDDQTALLPTLGRVGGPGTMKIIEAAMADKNSQRREAGFQALCLWPDASIAAKVLDLAQTDPDAAHRLLALRALVRVGPLPDQRPAAEKLELSKKAMALATRDDERNLVLKRCAAIRTVESLRFVAPYMEQPAYAQQACATVVELAHHRELREPNKAEFDQALDAVIRISEDAKLIDEAKRYKKGQT